MAGGNPVAFRDRLDWTIRQRSANGLSAEYGEIQERKYGGRSAGDLALAREFLHSRSEICGRTLSASAR